MLKLLSAFCLVLSVWVIFGCSPQPREVSLVFGGDVMLDRGVRHRIENASVESLFKDVAGVFSTADFVTFNLECPATEFKTPLVKKFVFRAEPEWLLGLRNVGVTHLILANNHSNDQGRSGLVSTAKHVTDANMVSLGYGSSQQLACSPVWLRKDGINTAIISSVLVPLESWAFLENEPGPCQATAEQIASQIQEVKRKDPKSIVIVSLHWGLEYQYTPIPTQREQAERLADAGADIIIGHHPHVVQTIEAIGNCIVIYSLGNLVFDSTNPFANQGVLARVVLSEETRPRIDLVPYWIKGCKPSLMGSREKATFMGKLQKISSRVLLLDQGQGIAVVLPE